ncbi:esterase-like activity of phytase family protein [Cohaesibacter sp. CAU 1516]|uniref:esterase-like activity of phytase family protein n=1 Tax=Cohaesibacter sp. CAU 1516 TaxID=2576038 RepID=UPI001485B725|nr:esterase-like activity of phytase family protein [Cohaesibacter sp. CAU 1516]
MPAHDPLRGRTIRPFGRLLACTALLGFSLFVSPQGLPLAVVPVKAAEPVRLPPVRLPMAAPKFESLSIQATPIRSFGGYGTDDNVYGKLHWLGGLELESDHDRFGGFSGLAFLDSQTFLAVGDKGTVLKARLLLKDGRPDGVEAGQMRHLPQLSERMEGWQRDSEGLALHDKAAYVSFEGDARVVRYGLTKEGTFTRQSRSLPLPRSVLRGAKANTGFEAIAFSPEGTRHDGSFILISERFAGDQIQGWIVRNGKAQAFTVPEQGGLAVTDAAFTRAGDLLILERKVSLFGGLQIRIRRVRAADFGAGAIERTDILLTGNLSHALDNMEGMAVQPQPDGSHLITLISDDNFNPLQRTLLLQFLLPAGQ